MGVMIKLILRNKDYREMLDLSRRMGISVHKLANMLIGSALEAIKKAKDRSPTALLEGIEKCFESLSREVLVEVVFSELKRKQLLKKFITYALSKIKSNSDNWKLAVSIINVELKKART